MNARLRKVTRNRGQFPTEQAALKVLYLAVRNLEEYGGQRSGPRARGGNKRSNCSRSTSRTHSHTMTATITYAGAAERPRDPLIRFAAVGSRGVATLPVTSPVLPRPGYGGAGG